MFGDTKSAMCTQILNNQQWRDTTEQSTLVFVNVTLLLECVSFVGINTTVSHKRIGMTIMTALRFSRCRFGSPSRDKTAERKRARWARVLQKILFFFLFFTNIVVTTFRTFKRHGKLYVYHGKLVKKLDRSHCGDVQINHVLWVEQVIRMCA